MWYNKSLRRIYMRKSIQYPWLNNPLISLLPKKAGIYPAGFVFGKQISLQRPEFPVGSARPPHEVPVLHLFAPEDRHTTRPDKHPSEPA